MATFDAVREVRIALTVEHFDQAVQFYRDRLGLAVVEEWQRPEGRGVILSLGPQTTLELFDGPQADFVDQVEVGRHKVSIVHRQVERRLTKHQSGDSSGYK